MTPAVELRHVSFHFDDATPALVDVSFVVAPGERIALVGPNGAGKTTLLFHLAGILPEQDGGAHGQGEVIVLGQVLQVGAENMVRREVGLLFQDPDDQLFCQTVGDDVGYAPAQVGMKGDALRQRVAEALVRVGLQGFEKRLPHRLSGGEKKRVALAGLLAYNPQILALDEPTSGLDPRSRRQLMTVLDSLPVTQVFATHDLALAAEMCPRTIVLDAGLIVADGPTKVLLRDDTRMALHGLERPSYDLPARLLDP